MRNGREDEMTERTWRPDDLHGTTKAVRVGGANLLESRHLRSGGRLIKENDPENRPRGT